MPAPEHQVLTPEHPAPTPEHPAPTPEHLAPTPEHDAPTREHLALAPDLRILSLIASATEIICALGMRDWMVGRSHECDFPEDVGALPQVTVPRLDATVFKRRD